uniref:Alpha beta hydrolase domain-containing protein 11-like n=1 Tax=Tetraselmis sp. GSL018 TaxID=582737 RepID=A0A061S9H1_9CHLO|eukprot:CAMPEP_0177589872 /NCGR_PEP_ID=MMETSP0419_2-20121207/7067_1 /TAXON_ID=582737 /ORGANISM="Tetraselmis sp., Strain GSL018" /LENGTH=298 /DNA_ID=CAMNT_0019080319 /DNA_START=52 /DNA_END=948 /DNA_ORIENTATION=-
MQTCVTRKSFERCVSSVLAGVAGQRAFTSHADRLAYELVEAGTDVQNTPKKTAVLLHGLLGSKRNWRMFSKALANELSTLTESPWSIYLVDLRNHGDSSRREGFNPPHDLKATARDLRGFTAGVIQPVHRRGPDVILGHSLGGKVVLEYLKQAAGTREPGAPKQAWVLDSVPGTVPGDSCAVHGVLSSVKEIPLPIPSREWLYGFLRDKGYPEGLRQWLGTNLVPDSADGSKLTWQFEIGGAESMYNSYRENSYWSLLRRPPAGTEIFLVRASESELWTPRDLTELQSIKDAPQVCIH